MAFDIKKLERFLPLVKKPTYKISLNKKLFWTGLVLMLYFMLSSQLFGHVYGITPAAVSQFKTLEMLLGSTFGTLMTLGIGPIVTSSILLQLLVGSKIINWNLQKPEDKEKYETIQKILSLTFCLLEAVIYVLAGAISPRSPDIITVSAVIFQLALGGVIVMLLDEIISKYGIGSGISLFIAAGVLNTVFIQVFSPCVASGTSGCSLPSKGLEPIGRFWALLINAANGSFSRMTADMVPLVSTIIIVIIVVFAQSITVDIPLSFGSMRGFGRRWSLNLFYTSNIPVILAGALLANMQLVGSLMARPTVDNPTLRCGIMGCFSDSAGNNQAISGLMYYITAPNQSIILDVLNGTLTNQLMLRMLTYTLFLTAGAILFSIFWVKTSGMDAESVANQISSIKMQIPGYRQNPRIIKGVLDKYIPPLAVIGGASIGLLASVADILGAFGSGTGILLRS